MPGDTEHRPQPAHVTDAGMSLPRAAPAESPDVVFHRATIGEERKRTQEADDTLSRQLTTILLGGSLGIIAISINFLKDIAPHPVFGSLRWLQGAWILLLGAALCGLATLITSRGAARHYRDVLFWKLAAGDPLSDKDRKAANRATKRCGRWNGATRIFRWIGLLAIMLGTTSLLWFANLNLPAEAVKHDGGSEAAAPRAPAGAKGAAPAAGPSIRTGAEGAGR